MNNPNPNTDTELIDFEVRIPNLDGDGISESHIIKVPAKRSPNGGWILTSDALDRIERTQSRYMGLMSPEEVKELRRRIQFTQKEMSDLIQAGEKSYTRWENGKVRLSRLVNIILCGIRDGFLPLPYLQTLYKSGSDWYKKVQSYESAVNRPISYKMSAPLALVDMGQPVAFEGNTQESSGWTASKSNWLAAA